MITEQEIKQHAENYNAHIKKINAMSVEEIDKLIAEDKCPYEPQHLLGVALGMHHCPLCGEMVVAGLNHPSREVPPGYEEALEQLALNPDNQVTLEAKS